MAESVRNLPGFFHCERLHCTLEPETCGKRYAAAQDDHPRMLPCKGCDIGAAHAREYGTESNGKRTRFLLDIAKGRSAEAKARRIAAKVKRQTYPEQVAEANEILAAVDARRAK